MSSLRFVDPKYATPHYSTKLWRGYYIYCKSYYSEKIFDDICAELKMDKEYLLSDDGWVSNQFTIDFMKLIKQKIGDPEIAKKVGAFTLDPRCINDFEYMIVRTLPLILIYAIIRIQARKLNQFHEFKLIKLYPGYFKYEMKPKTSEKACEDVFLNTEGVLNGTGALKGARNLEILKIEDGDKKEKVYFEIKYKISFISILKVIAMAAGVTLILLLPQLLQSAIDDQSTFGKFIVQNLGLAFSAFIFTIITTVFVIARFVIIIVHNHIFQADSMKKTNDLYQSKLLIERRFQEAKLLKSLSHELVGCRDPDEVIQKTLHSMKEKFGYDKAASFLVSKQRGKLYISNQIGFENAAVNISKIEFVYPNPDKKEPFFASILEKGTTTLIYDTEAYGQILMPQNRAILEHLEVGSMIVSPIQSGPSKYGVMVVIKKKNEKTLNDADKFLVDAISAQLSLYFESAANFEKELRLKSIFEKYVPKEALTQISSNLMTSDGSLEPQRRELCSIFMDLRGFTEACDGKSPERVFNLINYYAKFVTHALASQGAIIDNIIADSVVAFFLQDKNAPDDYILKTLIAAGKIAAEYETLKATLQVNGFAPLRLGIGINAGEAMVGSVGSEYKMNFTALGNPVTTASRLQVTSKNYKEDAVTIIVSETALVKIQAQTGIKFNDEVLRGHNLATKYTVLSVEQINLIVSRHQMKGAA